MRSVDFDIALSFAGEDREYVDRVANLLRDSGVNVFYDIFEEATLWGKNLYDYLSDVYQNKALYTIMFISEHYARKLWTNHERQAMQARAFQEHQEYILPARFDETPIPGVLPTTGYISLSNRSPEDFVKVIQKKLVNSGRTIPSESIRRAMFSVASAPRLDPITATVTVLNEEKQPIARASLTAIADNGTTKDALTSAEGTAAITIQTRRLYKLLIAHPDYPGAVVANWDPSDDLTVTLCATENLGSVIMHSTGHIPGLEGRLNPIMDTSSRTYLYADNIAINRGVQQPGNFQVDVPLELEDSNGVVMQVRVLHIQGHTSLIEYAHSRHSKL
ncbi:TIR domain-containing protein [Massilia pinisoli]|uniref:TIR domain-containing protein n=1 Tax=Massilia pinisoli TaxID=1772194 RepID=A0ABT1ZXE3_9BURK|nr:TIR domain-containing protein [Massilia pinisoli]MCS0584600.1 TIR domain-containing protein [Massilia pinisoli]